MMDTLTFRRFVEKLVSIGEGVVEEGVYDPVVEATRVLARAGERCVVLRVRGSDVPVAGNVMSNKRRVMMVLGVSREADLYAKLIDALSKPTPLADERSGADRKVFTSVDVLPVLKYYPMDGGKYVTSAIIIARDPDEGALNASVHRIMLIDGRHGVVRVTPRHLFMILNKYRRLGRKAPVVVAISPEPIVIVAAASSPPYGVFELEVANTLSGGRLRAEYFTEAELPVTSGTGIVITGHIDPSKLVNEGPFVDITGTYDIVRPQPVIEFEEVMVADDALYHAILPAGPEHRTLMGLPREAAVWDYVRRVVGEVKAVRLTPGSGGWLHAVISIRKRAEGEGKNAILAAFAAHPSLKHVVVVDDDVDVYNYEEVDWAIATRFRADRGLVIIHGARGSSLDPVADDGVTCKLGIDATMPVDADRSKFTKVRLR